MTKNEILEQINFLEDELHFFSGPQPSFRRIEIRRELRELKKLLYEEFGISVDDE